VLAQTSQPVPAAGANATFTFDQGLTPNTDYVVRLIARDAAGNCQPAFTDVAVHTADNVPPVTLTLRAANVTGTTAELHLQLDEPGVAYFLATSLDPGGEPAACPTAAQVFAGNRLAFPPSSPGAPAGLQTLNGSLVVPARSPAEPFTTLTGLASETDYAACVVARDATQLRNMQSAPQRVTFTTLDVTPPAVNVTVARAADGDVACQRAAPYLCSATWGASLSEPGAARWLLAVNDSLPQALPSPASLLSGTPLSNSLPGAVIVAEGNLTFPPNPSSPIVLASLLSKATYALLVAARDDALPQPNSPARVTVEYIDAPDLQPPSFLNYTLAEAADTALNFSGRLDEAATTHYVLVAGPSTAPNATEVFGGLAGGGAAPVAAGSVTSSGGNVTTPFSIGGLAAGRRYDLHMAAVDTAGNQQSNVTTLR
jgi:hypothetical protein